MPIIDPHKKTGKAAELLARLVAGAPIHISIDVQPAGLISLRIETAEITLGPTDTRLAVKQLLAALEIDAEAEAEGKS